MRARTWVSAIASAVLVGSVSLVAAVPAGADEVAYGTSADGVVPTYVAGNPTCADLGYPHEFKIDPPDSGTYDIDGTNTVTMTTDGYNVDWSSTLAMDLVIVKGGPNADAYLYVPEDLGDADLVTPMNPSGQPAGLSHVSFCYDYELVVTKTADTSLTRTWTWTIDKSSVTTDLLLSAGQSYPVNYSVVVDATSVDSDWAVEGDISIVNPDPTLAATITGVTDAVSPAIAATVDCGVTFPHVLAHGAALACTYSAPLPDGTTRTNTATAATEGAVGSGSGTTAVDFTAATVTGVDECIDVSDDPYGTLGTVCSSDIPKTINYSMDVSENLVPVDDPYAQCGDFTVTNVADFITNDTETTGTSDWVINVNIPCSGGCTLTQGYWKTHSQMGPAPYDDAWLLIGPAGASTPFFGSGRSYHQVLWTPPAGNAYYVLAHQYIAAKLNILNGAATTPAVTAAIAGAETFFQTKDPATTLTRAQRNALLALATTLDGYNNGLTGPGHCSDSSSS